MRQTVNMLTAGSTHLPLSCTAAEHSVPRAQPDQLDLSNVHTPCRCLVARWFTCLCVRRAQMAFGCYTPLQLCCTAIDTGQATHHSGHVRHLKVRFSSLPNRSRRRILGLRCRQSQHGRHRHDRRAPFMCSMQHSHAVPISHIFG